MGGDAAGRVALVTGGGRGIGRAVARLLSERGLRVAVTARGEDDLRATAAACPGPTLVLPADITAPGAVDEVFDRVAREWGPVRVLVANAGAGASDPVHRITDADWQRMLELNLTAPFRCIRRAVADMRGWGRIVAVASTTAKRGEPYVAAYTASKHGLLGLVRAVAAELAETGVTANAVCPGYVDTPMTEATVAAISERTGREPGQVRDLLAHRQPIGRLVTPEEVAEAVWFCVVNGAVTGQGINVDGGAVQS